jgi:diguanylate cyclase (GGDEF)-like protein/PAS domain S-box-containing protein
VHDPRSEIRIPDDGAGDRRRALRQTVLIALACFLVTSTGILGLWVAASELIRRDFRSHLTDLAIAAAQQVDPELHGSLRDPAQLNGPDYQRAVAPLRRVRLALPDVRYIYTMVRDESGRVHFVLDAADPGDHDGDGVEDQSGLWEVYEDEDPAMPEALGDGTAPGRATSTKEPTPDKWGNFMTGWAPLIGSDGRQFGILGVDVEASRYIAHLARARFWAFVGLVPALLLTVLLAIGFYRIRVAALVAARTARHAASVLSAEQQRLASVIEGTNVGTWQTTITPGNAGGDVITVDSRWAAMLGRDAAELNPMDPARFFALLVHPEDVPTIQAAVDHAMREEGYLIRFDVRLRHAAGHWVWTEVRGKVIERDAQGQPLRMVGTQMDVTARKDAELALQQSEASFRSLFELSPVGICQVEQPSGRFLMVNNSLVQSTGYSREELLRMTFWDITPPEWHEAERLEARKHHLDANFGPYEKEYRRKDGSCYPLLVSGTHVRDSLGRHIGWAIVQDISERKAMELQLADAANRDRLTGLANRALFMERLHRAIERVRAAEQPRFAVLFLDFDRFKLVNDAMGHEAGDRMLREVAARLRRELGVTEDELAETGHTLVARFGGDEFLILLNDPGDDAGAVLVAERLLAALAATYTVGEREIYSTASIGIVTNSQCMESAETVVRNADVAMYEAKRSGRARAVVFDDAMRARLTRYVDISTHLRQAIGTPELSLVYQPIFDLETGRMTSVEALSRWHHAELGQVSPKEFIPVAEESGLISQLGQWVLDEACRHLAAWRDQAPHSAPQTVSVNISRAELALGERLLEKVHAALWNSGLPPQCLQLEVTERDVMIDPAATLGLMRALRDMGVRLAMDDFGTGTSSLGCLRDYPFDVIKIDQSFVDNVTANDDRLAVLEAAITVIQNLGKVSVAEGVETPQQLAILKSLGCERGQGYFFSVPLSPQRLLEFMSSPAAEARSA